MTNLEEEKEKINGGDGAEKPQTVSLDIDESKANLINANGGAAGGDHLSDEFATDVKSGTSEEPPFNGLGKDEVMKYAEIPFWVRLRWILFILFWVGWVAMLVTAILIIVYAPSCPPRPELKWYHTDTIYSICSKSFKDSDGDGIGDFAGLKSEKDYIVDEADVGASAIWLDAIYEYEDNQNPLLAIKDHKAVDPKFGANVDQLKSWFKSLRKDMQKVILDLIPNQSSDKHTWFVESVKKVDEYKDYYIWAEGSIGSPPNSLQTEFGNPAWIYNSERKAWYFTRYGQEYPELNLRNEKVVKEILDIIKFWLSAGASGFHIQGLENLVEPEDIRDVGATQESLKNNRDSLDLLEKMRKVVKSYDKPGRERVLFGTVRSTNKNQTMEYWGTDDKKRLDIVVPVMDWMDDAITVSDLKTHIEKNLVDEERNWVGYALGDGEVVRIANRQGINKQTGDGPFKQAQSIQMLLQGTAINYYGDEFGQTGVDAVTKERYTPLKSISRLPMQWNSEVNAGFSVANASSLWLELGPNYKTINVEASRAHFNDKSPLKSFQDLNKLRKRESFQWGKTLLCTPEHLPDLLAFTRKAERFPFFLVFVNKATRDTFVPVRKLHCGSSLDSVSKEDGKQTGTVVYSSMDGDKENKKLELDQYIKLDAHEVLVLEFSADD